MKRIKLLYVSILVFFLTVVLSAVASVIESILIGLTCISVAFYKKEIKSNV